MLAIRSGLFPRVLGVLLMAGSSTYLLDVLLRFLAPPVAVAINPVVVVVATLSEVSMLGYLLVRGVRSVPASPAAARGPAVTGR